MFCEKCGVKLDHDANFCTSCGMNINESINKIKKIKIEDNEILLTVKPTFKFLYKFLTSKITLTILLPLTFMMFFVSVMEMIEGSEQVALTFVSMMGSPFLVALLIYLVFEKTQYDNYRYDLYKTKVIYIDGFINKTEKEIKYKHIKEITMKQNIIQRYFGIGTIIICTTAENVVNNKASLTSPLRNGIYILDIEDVDNIYKKIKEIINI